MTDFLDRLETELTAAHARRTTPGPARRALDAAPRALAPVAIACLAIGGGAALAVVLSGGDDTMSPPAGKRTPPSPVVAPLDAHARNTPVAVLNGTTVSGLARAVADRLTAAGVKVDRVGTARNQASRTTTVAYAPGHHRDALAIAAQLSLYDRGVRPSSGTSTTAGPPTAVTVVRPPAPRTVPAPPAPRTTATVPAPRTVTAPPATGAATGGAATAPPAPTTTPAAPPTTVSGTPAAPPKTVSGTSAAPPTTATVMTVPPATVVAPPATTVLRGPYVRLQPAIQFRAIDAATRVAGGPRAKVVVTLGVDFARLTTTAVPAPALPTTAPVPVSPATTKRTPVVPARVEIGCPTDAIALGKFGSRIAAITARETWERYHKAKVTSAHSAKAVPDAAAAIRRACGQGAVLDTAVVKIDVGPHGGKRGAHDNTLYVANTKAGWRIWKILP